MKRAIPGFLLIEATIAILISIIMSSVIVLYHSKASTLRAQALSRSYLLTDALETMEGIVGGITVGKGVVYSIPLSYPRVEGVAVIIPPLSPCVSVCVSNEHHEQLVLTRWVGEGS